MFENIPNTVYFTLFRELKISSHNSLNNSQNSHCNSQAYKPAVY